MKHKTARRIILFFIFFLPLQYAAVGIIGLGGSEPWPAFVFPAFQHIDATPRYVFIEKTDFTVIDTAGKTHANVAPEKLFSNIQVSQLPSFLKMHFSDSSQWKKKGKDSREWLLNQINKNYPQLDPKALRISLKKTYFNLSNSKIKVDSVRTVNEFVVSLTNDQN